VIWGAFAVWLGTFAGLGKGFFGDGNAEILFLFWLDVSAVAR